EYIFSTYLYVVRMAPKVRAPLGSQDETNSFSCLLRDAPKCRGKFDTCNTCVKAEMKCHPAPRRKTTRTHHILEAIYADLTGPMHVDAIFSGARYILTIVDDFSHRVFTFTLKTRDEASSAIQFFILRREKETVFFVK